VAERTLDRSAEAAAARFGEKAIGRSSERAAGRIGEQALARGSERATERVGEKALTRSSERVADRVLDRSAERLGEKAAARAGERMSQELMSRVGRGLLITLPALGGIFAIYLLRTDLKRLREERLKRAKSSTFLFAGAAFADGLDAVVHFWIAYAYLTELGHHALMFPEKCSLACAIMSTIAAFAGEIVSLRKQKQKTKTVA
jgi:hypothetical protein